MFVFRKIWRFIFLKHPFWDSPFYFITDEINKNVKGKILLRKIWQSPQENNYEWVFFYAVSSGHLNGLWEHLKRSASYAR